MIPLLSGHGQVQNLMTVLMRAARTVVACGMLWDMPGMTSGVFKRKDSSAHNVGALHVHMCRISRFNQLCESVADISFSIYISYLDI